MQPLHLRGLPPPRRRLRAPARRSSPPPCGPPSKRACRQPRPAPGPPGRRPRPCIAQQEHRLALVGAAREEEPEMGRSRGRGGRRRQLRRLHHPRRRGGRRGRSASSSSASSFSPPPSMACSSPARPHRRGAGPRCPRPPGRGPRPGRGQLDLARPVPASHRRQGCQRLRGRLAGEEEALAGGGRPSAMAKIAREGHLAAGGPPVEVEGGADLVVAEGEIAVGEAVGEVEAEVGLGAEGPGDVDTLPAGVEVDHHHALVEEPLEEASLARCLRVHVHGARSNLYNIRSPMARGRGSERQGRVPRGRRRQGLGRDHPPALELQEPVALVRRPGWTSRRRRSPPRCGGRPGGSGGVRGRGGPRPRPWRRRRRGRRPASWRPWVQSSGRPV